MNLFEFYVSIADEDPQALNDKVYKITDFIGVSSEEKALLSAYQLKGVSINGRLRGLKKSTRLE